MKILCCLMLLLAVTANATEETERLQDYARRLQQQHRLLQIEQQRLQQQLGRVKQVRQALRKVSCDQPTGCRFAGRHYTRRQLRQQARLLDRAARRDQELLDRMAEQLELLATRREALDWRLQVLSADQISETETRQTFDIETYRKK